MLLDSVAEDELLPPERAPRVRYLYEIESGRPLTAVQQSVLMTAGARPWDRDYDDVRLIADVAEGRGRIIDSENDLHGYPTQTPTRRPFNEADWNLDDMTPRRPEVLDSGTKARGT